MVGRRRGGGLLTDVWGEAAEHIMHMADNGSSSVPLRVRLHHYDGGVRTEIGDESCCRGVEARLIFFM